jgi:hypothetical protein
MQEKGPEAVKLIKDVSVNGRACKQTPTINALAICARSSDPKTKAAAYAIGLFFGLTCANLMTSLWFHVCLALYFVAK